MKFKLYIFFSVFLSINNLLTAQLKYVIEDFEGCDYGPKDLKPNGLFVYGNIKANIDGKMSVPNAAYSGERSIKITEEGSLKFGGWGKGIGAYVELDVTKDYLNFYVFSASTNAVTTIKIELQEDDNGDNSYNKDNDDSWVFDQKINPKNTWELISIPLRSFKDNNHGGNGGFDASYKNGKIFSLIFSFDDGKANSISNLNMSFDFICFSQGILPTGTTVFSAPSASASDFCSLGLWSKEGNTANFTEIATNFENNFKYGSDKKLGVIHFFQPFAFDGGNTQNSYPSIERINKVIKEGYIPMITLEDHFVNTHPNAKQPNLYSIIEGHFDEFFKDWAKEIKQVNGTVLLRILHEFNGDWYPWCTKNNDKNPEMVVKAYRHIRDIFKAQNVTNVKFIWCPNSMSIPQEKWNFVMDAYPGDQYVDFVALDIYNGAGTGAVWRSFRKEAIENYFILTQRLAHKPLLVCEAASREKGNSESESAQDKAEWIKQMSEALSSDMSKVRLMAWFNEKGTFKITSSKPSQYSYLTNILNNNYFKSGSQYMYQVIGK